MSKIARPGDLDMFEPDNCWRLTDAAWAWVQLYAWEYRDGTPYAPDREDTYMEYRDALVAEEGWAYRVEHAEHTRENENSHE